MAKIIEELPTKVLQNLSLFAINLPHNKTDPRGELLRRIDNPLKDNDVAQWHMFCKIGIGFVQKDQRYAIQ